MIKAIFIVGPTASGKTALSINIAKKFGGEIISADSMQLSVVFILHLPLLMRKKNAVYRIICLNFWSLMKNIQLQIML